MVLQLRAQSGSKLDPAFKDVPFDQWQGEQQAKFKWSARIGRPELTFHLRLEAMIGFTVDGRELETRRNDQQLLLLFQITDSSQNRYQGHAELDLTKLDKNVKAAELQYVQRAFLLPGDYDLAAALVDKASGEHAILREHFKVTWPTSGFLSEAWGKLPPVEYIRDEPSPDGWYLPDIRGQLRWAETLEEHKRLNVLLNIAESAPAFGTRKTPGEGLQVLLPTLKAFGESGSEQLEERTEVLDLARHKTVFHGDVAESGLDWSSLKAGLGDANTASIDVHALADRQQDAQFFVGEVRKVLRASDKPSVLVVLATPVAFEKGQDLDPISLESLPACRVFYIRYEGDFRGAMERNPQQNMGMRRRGGMGMGRGEVPHAPIDQLENTLKPLNPKVFDVQTPDQLVHAFIEIRKAISSQ